VIGGRAFPRRVDLRRLPRLRRKSTAALVGVLVGVLVGSWGTVPVRAGLPDHEFLDPDLDTRFVPEDPIPLQPGNGGPWVRKLQLRLNAVGFHAGDTDGVFGRQTLAAVYAFQKHHGLERTGAFLPEQWPLLDQAVASPGEAPQPERVEIDLARQVLYLIADDSVTDVLPISSANGGTYRNAAGRLVRAETPEGAFTFQRRRPGWWKSYLGWLYQPFYFRGGYALHGSGSVPPHPASHGCVRVEIFDMDFLLNHLRVGMPVYVYGDDLTRAEVVPVVETPTPAQPAPDPGPVTDDPPASRALSL